MAVPALPEVTSVDTNEILDGGAAHTHPDVS